MSFFELLQSYVIWVCLHPCVCVNMSTVIFNGMLVFIHVFDGVFLFLFYICSCDCQYLLFLFFASSSSQLIFFFSVEEKTSTFIPTMRWGFEVRQGGPDTNFFFCLSFFSSKVHLWMKRANYYLVRSFQNSIFKHFLAQNFEKDSSSKDSEILA